jgi:hypothetical protein
MNSSEEEFYVGYLKKAPAAVAVFVRARILLILLFTAAAGAGLALTQKNILPVTFEFGVFRTLEGVLYERPYPHLLVQRPSQGKKAPSFSRYTIVAPGKMGAADLAKGFDGKRVSLEGSLIYKDTQVMIELKPGSISEQTGAVPPLQSKLLGTHSFVGEIVDSKCYLGVMNPGNTKTHKACAIRCISGGIPPVLLVRDAAGMATYFMLVDENGKAVNDRVLNQIAEPVRITGLVEQIDNLLILKANPDEYEHL